MAKQTIENRDFPDTISQATTKIGENFDELYALPDLIDEPRLAISPNGPLKTAIKNTLVNLDIIAAKLNPFKNAFITIWKTDNPDGVTNDYQIKIPTSGDGYDCLIDDGNGNITSHVGTSNGIIITYPTKGTYTVKIIGSFPIFAFAGGGDRTKLINITQWGNIAFWSLNASFYYAVNCIVSATDKPNLSLCVSMDYAFNHSNVNVNVGDWDITNISSFDFAFDGSALTQPNYDLLLIGWAAQDVKPNCLLGAGTVKYSSAASDARAILISKGWTITDGGLL